MRYQARAFCTCGFSVEPSFGDIWYAQQHNPVCPRCGECSSVWEMHTVKWVSRGWFNGGDWTTPDGNIVKCATPTPGTAGEGGE